MRYVGWLLFAATVVFVVLQGLFLAASDYSMVSTEILVDGAFPLVPIGALVGAAVGALIISRYPGNPVGWLFCLGQLGNAISLAAGAFAGLVAQGTIDAPEAGRVAQDVGLYLNATYTAAFLAVIFMIAPDGRLLSKRWRFAVPIPVAAWILHVGFILAVPVEDLLLGIAVDLSPLVIALDLLSGALLVISLGLGALALGLRLRRSTGKRRQQLRWIATSAVALTVAFVLLGMGNLVLGPEAWPLVLALHLAYIGVTVSVGVAILKYRLYDIEVIASKAIVLAVLAVFVTVGYIAVVVAIGSLLSAIGTPGSTLFWPSLVATALVAVAFQPLRRHVLRLADQLVYGNRAAPYEALATLSRRLADSPSPDALPARVAEATGRAVGAARTVVRLGEPHRAAASLTASWPSADAAAGTATAAGTAGTVLELPVADMGEQVGSIEVTMPPGRALRTFERELLQDAAGQAGVAFRNALLEAELATRVEQTESQSTELAESRRRLVGVEDEARKRLASAIRRGVIPHLTTVQAALGSDGAVIAASGELDQLIAETERALQELRTVCRGVFPALLERRGLVPALSAELGATHPLATLEVAEPAHRRPNRAAEGAAYLFCLEVAPTDRRCLIDVRVTDDRLVATVSADEMSADDAWQHARDRVAALDGEVLIGRNTDGSMRVQAVIPLDDQSAGNFTASAALDVEMSAHTSASRSGPKADLGT